MSTPGVHSRAELLKTNTKTFHDESDAAVSGSEKKKLESRLTGKRKSEALVVESREEDVDMWKREQFRKKTAVVVLI